MKKLLFRLLTKGMTCDNIAEFLNISIPNVYFILNKHLRKPSRNLDKVINVGKFEVKNPNISIHLGHKTVQFEDENHYGNPTWKPIKWNDLSKYEQKLLNS